MRDETRDIIVEAYQRLGTYEKVKAETGFCSASIWKALKDTGLGPGIGGNQSSLMKATDEQILAAIDEGLTRQEIADRYGMHVENLAKRMHSLCVHANYAKSKKIERANEWHWSSGTADMVERYQNGRFELVEFKHDKMRIRCKTCGAVIERVRSTIRRNNIACDGCKAAKEQQEAREKLLRVLSAVAESKIPKTCAVCGEVFYSQYKTKKYCSSKCRNRARRSGNHRSRAKKYGCRYESGITLVKVYERDHGICQICGKPVDWNDKSWRDDFGALYPTIDHITAFANGGGHTWDNVQLAHAVCNSYKRDLITV